MKHKLFFFDGQTVKTETVDSPGRLRWASWNAADDDGTALIAGDKGALMAYARGRFTRIPTHTSENLRCVEFSPKGDAAFACGNNGTILSATLSSSEPLRGSEARENLRRVGWSNDGENALFVGNDGAAYSLHSGDRAQKIPGAETHLRSVAWHPRDGFALVSGNCFQDSVGGLTPSPNLYRFEEGASSLVELQEIAESRADLTGASWKPDGTSSLLVGYDQTWHTPASFSFEDGSIRQIPWAGGSLFPTTCTWHPSGGYALIGTGIMRPGEGDCAIYRYDGAAAEGIKKQSDLGEFGVSCIAWSPDGAIAIMAASSSVRAFS